LKLEKSVGSKSVPYGERTKRGDQVKKSVDIHGEREKRSADRYAERAQGQTQKQQELI